MINMFPFKKRFHIEPPKTDRAKLPPTLYHEPATKDMAVLLCYFNPCKYFRIMQNALMVKHLFDCAKIPYFITEIKHDDDSGYFFTPSDNIFQYSSNSYMFYKENLITTMEKRISDQYTKICIIDFDILFDNPDWYSIISDKLNHVSVTQPFKNAHYLNLDYSISQTKTNCIDYKTNDEINYSLEHTGFIWAFDRTWFRNYKFDDECIIGAGDSILSNKITKRKCSSLGSKIFFMFSIKEEYLDEVIYDSCELNVYHLSHGPLLNRQYISFKQIMYDLFVTLNIKKIDDVLVRRDDNILEWNPTYIDIFNRTLMDYFKKRNDDCI